MSLVGFKGQNHQQQLAVRGPRAAVDNRATPPEYFATLHERFAFTVDAAALPHNAKLPRYFTPEVDGLEQDWAGERVWCNPPYSSIEPWVVKAATSGAALVVMLLPANRTEQGWWQRRVEPVRDRPGGGPERVPARSAEVHRGRRHARRRQRAAALRLRSADLGRRVARHGRDARPGWHGVRAAR